EELLDGRPRHYMRPNPTDLLAPVAHPDPITTPIAIPNQVAVRPALTVVGRDFFHLVRFGILAADDPIVLDSIKVRERVLKRDLPEWASWGRYNCDGYGQKDAGSAFDGTGRGRCWPMLTGERGHYELAAGRYPNPFIEVMEKFANDGGMISEQLWEDDD